MKRAQESEILWDLELGRGRGPSLDNSLEFRSGSRLARLLGRERALEWAQEWALVSALALDEVKALVLVFESVLELAQELAQELALVSELALDEVKALVLVFESVLEWALVSELALDEEKALE